MKQQFHSFTLSQRNENLLSLHKILYRIHGSFIRNSPRLKTAKISFNGWMVKQIVVYQYYGLLLSSKNEWTTDTHNNLDELPGNYCEGEKLISQSYVFYDSNHIFLKWQNLKTLSRSVVGIGWWWGRVWEGSVCCYIDKKATGRILVVMYLDWCG